MGRAVVEILGCGKPRGVKALKIINDELEKRLGL